MAEFSDALILTSPHIKGARVKDAQYLLKGRNRFKGLDAAHCIATYKGKLDGDCGPATIAAAVEAKNLLGYPANQLYRSFGQTEYMYLLDTSLPKIYQKRRAERLAALELTVGQKALNVALSQIGYTESPYGSNHTKYGVWYGFDRVPWCDIFISWCLDQVGYYYHESYVPDTVQRARSGNRSMFTSAPKPGDLVTYNIPGEGADMHIAFYHSKINSSSFYDVGGNTGPANMSNGGAVLKQVRYNSMVSHFIRLK